ncbi:hypothetical protein V9T40_007166 [Parthenolecanium corni]|uniref:Conserved oligomeric Golgi complex subunit 2 n=1 Tax=Parthenolecanium corni TaxID=536013 RepID=A0AAN9TVY3_9HEMI
MDFKHNTLCFDEKLFFKKDFSVDEFLTEHRRIANLETLRDDLGIFLKNLRSSTIELINKDYADFVDLSTNLKTLEAKIAGMETPIGKIKEEVLTTKIKLDNRLNIINNLLNQRKLTRKKMQGLHSSMTIQLNLERLNSLLSDVSNADTSSNILKLERALNEINQYYFHSKHCEAEFMNSVSKEFENIFEIFQSHLRNSFLKAIKQQNKSLTNCLRLYVAVDKVSLAHELVRQELVSPIVSEILREDSHRDEPSGLNGLFSKVLLFLDRELKYLLDLTQSPGRDGYVRGFDFMVHCIWLEIEERLEFNLKSIYFPGNPDTFFKNYTATLAFLNALEERCVTRTSVSNLRKTNAYQNFMHCWNLSVYYTMRFQEYGGNLEKVINLQKTAHTKNSSEWKLAVTEEVWTCLFRCWNEDVFIRQLTHRFWKFNLQTLARYRVWMETMTEAANLNQLPSSKIDFLIQLYSDGYTLSDKFPIILNIVKQRLGDGVSLQVLQNMEKCLDESKDSLLRTLKKVEKKFIELVIEKNISIIRQVSDIPRLYRRTNREAPTQPCPYVASLFSPIENLQKSHPSHASNWIPAILSAFTSAYHEQVSEVLTSVQRTEESLRKFKKIRDPSNSDYKQNTDDYKIRLQLQIDIESYINAVKKLSSEAENVANLQELNNILESLKRN